MKRSQRAHAATPLGEFVDRENVPHSPVNHSSVKLLPMYYYDPQDPHILGPGIGGKAHPVNLARPEGWLVAAGIPTIIGAGWLGISLGSHNYWIGFAGVLFSLSNFLYLAYLRSRLLHKEPRLKRMWRAISHSRSAPGLKEPRVYKREGFRRRTVASKAVLMHLSTGDHHQSKKHKQGER